jgi:hypothetical protein
LPSSRNNVTGMGKIRAHEHDPMHNLDVKPLPNGAISIF